MYLPIHTICCIFECSPPFQGIHPPRISKPRSLTNSIPKPTTPTTLCILSINQGLTTHRIMTGLSVLHVREDLYDRSRQILMIRHRNMAISEVEVRVNPLIPSASYLHPLGYPKKLFRVSWSRHPDNSSTRLKRWSTWTRCCFLDVNLPTMILGRPIFPFCATPTLYLVLQESGSRKQWFSVGKPNGDILGSRILCQCLLTPGINLFSAHCYPTTTDKFLCKLPQWKFRDPL